MAKIKIEKDNPLHFVIMGTFILILGSSLIMQTTWLFNGVLLEVCGQTAEAEITDW